jgi:phage terminase large subunit-like protein
MTTRDRLAALSPEQRRTILAGLSPEQLHQLAYSWPFWARPAQLPPGGRHWRTWVLQGGRGAGKTKTASETIRADVEAGRRRSIGAMGMTADTVRRDMVQGPAGILEVCPPWEKPSFEPGTNRIVWPNGAVVYLLSAEEPNRARGLNLDMMWIDELTSFSDPEAAWNISQMALRIPGPLGDPPICIITSTPRSVPVFKRIRSLPTTVITISPTMDNAQNLSPEALASLVDQFGGTRLGRQELGAEMIDDVDGALWSRQLIDECRIRRGTEPERMRRICWGRSARRQ